MNDSADILLVDSHPECDGCHNTDQGPIHEFVLNLLPFLIFHAGMIRMRIDFIGAKERCNVFSRFLQGNINNARGFGCFADSLQQAGPFFRIIRRRYLQKEIVPIKSGNKHIVLENIKLSAHVVSYLGCCRRGQQQRLIDTDVPIREISPPTDAVRSAFRAQRGKREQGGVPGVTRTSQSRGETDA